MDLKLTISVIAILLSAISLFRSWRTDEKLKKVTLAERRKDAELAYDEILFFINRIRGKIKHAMSHKKDLTNHSELFTSLNDIANHLEKDFKVIDSDFEKFSESKANASQEELIGFFTKATREKQLLIERRDMTYEVCDKICSLAHNN